MKIGIVTYHRSHNYGALLQAVALQSVLAEEGHEVTYVDYWPPYHKHLYEVFSVGYMKKRTLKANLRYIFGRIIKYKYIKKRYNNFEDFISQFITPHLSSMDDSYDLIIYGSDQIWRKQREILTYDSFYFGKNKIKAQRQISYAASMGITTCSDNDKIILKEYLSYLDDIAVRESDLLNLVKEIGFNCKLTLDPTLLLSSEKWRSIMNLEKKSIEKYVLYYKLMDNSFDDKQVHEFANQRGLNLKVLYGDARRPKSQEDISTAGPLQFLDYIYNAEFVFTSSYHGLAFSVIFHKAFYASFKKNAGRGYSLLSMLGLSDRMLKPYSKIPESTKPIDYKKIQLILNRNINISKKYLNGYGK